MDAAQGSGFAAAVDGGFHATGSGGFDAAALRDRARTTRLLILAELMEPVPLSEVARRLGISVQAVSAHVQRLRAQGLVGTDRRPSPQGMQALAQDAEALRRAVAGLAARVASATAIGARAAAPVRAGQAVRLAMHDGDLVAWPLPEDERARTGGAIDGPGTDGPDDGPRAGPDGGAGSVGVARRRAAAGDEVVVERPSGIVAFALGRLDVVVLPGPGAGGVGVVDRRRIGQRHGRRAAAALVACMGTGAAILADRLGWPVALRFAPDHAAFNAAQRGLDVLLLVTADRLPEALRTLEALNAASGGRVAVRLEPAPLRADAETRREAAAGADAPTRRRP